MRNLFLRKKLVMIKTLIFFCNWHIFSLTTSQMPKLISKADWNKNVYISIQKISWERFNLHKKKLFPMHCILKSCLANGRVNLWRYHMGYLKVLVNFYLQNHSSLVNFSYLNFTPVNLYPNYNSFRESFVLVWVQSAGRGRNTNKLFIISSQNVPASWG